jgi:threonine/homoserine/homoserine lactone efflux protein
MSDLVPLLLFSISTTFTPGPNNIMIMNSGMNFGIQKSLPHYLGICFGFPAMVLMVALGLGVVFMEYAWIKHLLKILGSIYMLYLVWQILISSSKANLGKIRKPLSFLQAAMFQWVNPKAWLMAISTISIFTISSHYFNNALIISVVYFLMCIPCIGAWLVFGKFLQRILKKDSYRLWFNIFMALALIGSIGMILFD